MRFKRESSATPTTCPRPGRQCMLFALTLVALAGLVLLSPGRADAGTTIRAQLQCQPGNARKRTRERERRRHAGRKRFTSHPVNYDRLVNAALRAAEKVVFLTLNYDTLPRRVPISCFYARRGSGGPPEG